MTAPANVTTAKVATAKVTKLFFGKRAYDAETARRAAQWFRVRGYAVTERHVPGGDYLVETNAPRTVAINVKRAARASRVRV